MSCESGRAHLEIVSKLSTETNRRKTLETEIAKLRSDQGRTDSENKELQNQLRELRTERNNIAWERRQTAHALQDVQRKQSRLVRESQRTESEKTALQEQLSDMESNYREQLDKLDDYKKCMREMGSEE